MSGPSRGWIRQTGARLTGFLVLACSLVLGACTSLPRTPYTAAEASTSRVLDIDGLRRYADEPVTKFSFEKDTSTATKSYLALSGGGADGAYGVGVLSGWTAARTRPTFSVVSGVSTGGLIAPFAFLGSQYDDTLREVYTSGIAESLLNDPSIMRVLFGSGLFGNTRLRELVARYVGPEIMAQVARENAKGPKAAGGDHRSRHPADRHLGHGQDRSGRNTRGAQTVSRRDGGLRQHSPGVSAHHDRR
ncbi:hypothetical protein AB7M69_006033 [Bradyrhizobium japonicum]